MYNEIMFTRLNKLIFTNKIDLKFPVKLVFELKNI